MPKLVGIKVCSVNPWTKKLASSKGRRVKLWTVGIKRGKVEHCTEQLRSAGSGFGLKCVVGANVCTVKPWTGMCGGVPRFARSGLGLKCVVGCQGLHGQALD